MNFLTTVSSSV